MPSDVKFEKCSASDIVPTSTFEYMSCVGALLYLALTVRPYIAFAVGQLSRYMSCPTPDCVRVAKQCMNYLHVTRDLGSLSRNQKVGNGAILMSARTVETSWRLMWMQTTEIRKRL